MITVTVFDYDYYFLCRLNWQHLPVKNKIPKGQYMLNFNFKKQAEETRGFSI